MWLTGAIRLPRPEPAPDLLREPYGSPGIIFRLPGNPQNIDTKKFTGKIIENFPGSGFSQRHSITKICCFNFRYKIFLESVNPFSHTVPEIAHDLLCN
jgi:hypothetical protein